MDASATRERSRPARRRAAFGLLWAAALDAGCGAGSEPGSSPGGPATSPRIVSSRTLTDDGGRVDWCRASGLIAFDRVTAVGRTEVYSVRPDGSEERCITCGNPGGMPVGVRGQPAWDPSCTFLVIQVQAPSYSGQRHQFVSFGLDNDLWFVAADGSWAQPAVRVAPCEGALHPQISDSGDRLFWAMRRRTGQTIPQIPLDPTPCQENPWDGWRLAIAPLARSGGARPAVGGATEIYADEGGFFESHALVGDTLWFSHTGRGLPYVDDVFTARADGSRRTNLTQSANAWDEHAKPSPGGRAWAFNSSRSFAWTPVETALTLRLELWAMVGSQDAVRLTDLNGSAPAGTRVLTADFAWGPSGRELALYHADISLAGTRQVIDVLTLDQAY